MNACLIDFHDLRLPSCHDCPMCWLDLEVIILHPYLTSPRLSSRPGAWSMVIALVLKYLWISTPCFSVRGWWAEDTPISRLPLSFFLADWGSLHLFVWSKSATVIVLSSPKEIYSVFYLYFVDCAWTVLVSNCPFFGQRFLLCVISHLFIDPYQRCPLHLSGD